MPTLSEKVVNRPLSGIELKAILRAAFDKLLDGEGLLADRVAYGRVSYELRLTLHTGNVFWPVSVTTVDSARRGAVTDVLPVAEGEQLPQPEPIPMRNPPPDAMFGATQLDHTIDNPNAERLRHDMAIPVERRQADGTTITEPIKYPKGSVESTELGEGHVKVHDATAAARRDLGLDQ
jgi:hypothetical protein